MSSLTKGCPILKPIFSHSVVAIYGLQFTEGCQFAEDLEFWCHLFRVGLKLRILLEPLYFYRLTPHSLAAKANKLRNYSHWLSVFDRLLAQQGFSMEEKRLLEHCRRKAEKEQYYLLFVYNLEKHHYREALRCVRQRPYVLFQFFASLPHSLVYRVSARMKKGAVKS